MNIATMRIAVADSYPRRGWREKVKRMPEEQILAIYKRLEREGKLKDNLKEKQKKDPTYVQMRMILEKEFGS